MRNFFAKFLILPVFAINTLAANASIYKYTFAVSNLVDANDGGVMDGQGDLTGFFVLDTSLINNDPNYLAQNVEGQIAIPNWITQVSLTYTPDTGSGNSSYSKTTSSASFPIAFVWWEVDDPTSFDPGADDFIGQMSKLSFGNNSRFGTSGFMIQEYSFSDAGGAPIGAEFTFTDPVDPVQVPGPLPLLGLAPLAYYFRKLKRSLNKN